MLKNMFKRIPAEIKDEILEKVKNGMTIKDAARQYALLTKTIYTWSSNQVRLKSPLLNTIDSKKKTTNLKKSSCL